MLRGKGLWARRQSELDRALEIAPRAGVTHIIYKVAHGASYRRGMAEIANQIQRAGRTPIAWIWLELDDPHGESEAVARAFREGFQGCVFDTEDASCRNRFGQATRLGQLLTTAGVDPHRLFNCSFPNISHHRDLPYDQLNEFCKGGLMPMSYGSFFPPGSSLSPQQQAERVIDEWTYGHYEYWCRHWQTRPPMCPVLGPYHDEYGNKRMSPGEFQVWLDRLADHGPAFFSVFTAAVIGEDLLPLIQAFPLGEAEPAAATPGLKLEVVTPRSMRLNVRSTPSTELRPVAQVLYRTVLESLEPAAATREKVGRDGQWLRVRTPDGVEGFVAAWYLRLVDVVRATMQVEAVNVESGYVVVRSMPAPEEPVLTRVDDGTVLDTVEPEDAVRAKLEDRDGWLHVRTPSGVEGFVRVAHLTLLDEPVSHLVVHSAAGLNVRRAPDGDSSVVWHINDRTVLEVQESASHVAEKLSRDKWIRVSTPSLREGYVNGLYARRQREPDRRARVRDSSLPYGECAWIFGIHAANAGTPTDFRYLFRGKDKTGWVLFTEALGDDPRHGQGHDHRRWAYDGYGVIVRLNHGYDTAGTLPVRARYERFSSACSAYVQKSKGCHVWIIGNEQNNVREHPGGDKRPVEHISPEMYAEAFNLTRRRIKQASPDAIVVPGAVDPYFGLPWPLDGRRYRPLDYFRTMLANIEDLDGICLHAYTHWLDPALISKPTVFTDPFLQPGTRYEHYYDFLTYRTFAEAVPQKWRDRPIYITESNHWAAAEGPPESNQGVRHGWVNVNRGWVRAAYKEIDRWNNTPHAQQIHCLLLYRWTGDGWAIEGKEGVLEDFRQALDQDSRWRR